MGGATVYIGTSHYTGGHTQVYVHEWHVCMYVHLCTLYIHFVCVMHAGSSASAQSREDHSARPTDLSTFLISCFCSIIWTTSQPDFPSLPNEIL